MVNVDFIKECNSQWLASLLRRMLTKSILTLSKSIMVNVDFIKYCDGQWLFSILRRIHKFVAREKTMHYPHVHRSCKEHMDSSPERQIQAGFIIKFKILTLSLEFCDKKVLSSQVVVANFSKCSSVTT